MSDQVTPPGTEVTVHDLDGRRQGTPPGTEVTIHDLKVSRQKNNGVCYCTLRNHKTGELIIAADLKYIMAAIKERKFILIDPQDVLEKVAQFNMYHERRTNPHFMDEALNSGKGVYKP